MFTNLKVFMNLLYVLFACGLLFLSHLDAAVEIGLTAVTRHDVAELANTLSRDSSAKKLMGYSATASSIEIARTFNYTIGEVENGRGLFELVVVEKKVIGFLSIGRNKDRGMRFELESYIFPEFRSKGYGTEAQKIMIALFFRAFADQDELYAKVFENNGASKRVKAKIGFEFLGNEPAKGTNPGGMLFVIKRPAGKKSKKIDYSYLESYKEFIDEE